MRPKQWFAVVGVTAAVMVGVILAIEGGQASSQRFADPAAGSSAATVSKVRGDVRLVLERMPSARVIVALRQPPALQHAPLQRDSLLRDVAYVQDRVLSSLGPSDFQVVHRYEGIAGLAGYVSEHGLEKLAAHPEVVSVTLDEVGAGALSESVPLINADDVHGLGITGAGVMVAVLDSGVDTDHPDLTDDIVVEECFLSTGGCPPGGGTRSSGPGAAEDDHGHGTNVTGIVTSNGTVAPVGVAPDADIAAYKVLNSSNSGWFSDWNAALSDIIANHPEVDVVNMSLVSYSTFSGACDSYQPTTTSAINTLRAAGTLTFVSSGNNRAKNAMTYPACVSGAVSVGAVYDVNLPSSTFFGCTDQPAHEDQVTCWSNSDATLDLLAPGAFTTSTGLGGGTSTFGGTSQASPHAAAVAALLLQSEPLLTADQIEARLESTGLSRTDPANGRVTPRVDALAAITDNPFPTPTPTITATPTVTPTPGPDSDSDGCSDVEELGPNPVLGGDRDPFNFWDFFEVTGDKSIDFSDTLDILEYFGDPGNPGTHGDLCDRSIPDEAKPWRTADSDDGVDLTDALNNLVSFGHDCSGPP